jgi:hypothetical protein
MVHLPILDYGDYGASLLGYYGARLLRYYGASLLNPLIIPKPPTITYYGASLLNQ